MADIDIPGFLPLAEAIRLAVNHRAFLDRNTGTTYKGDEQHFVLNPQGVLANNRHFIAYTRQEYQPNGDATTEGQSLLITGFAQMFKATKDPVWLEKAEFYWDAYFNYFYDGQSLPPSPKPMYANWIVNGKEPIPSHYPVDPDYATHGGFKCVPLMFVNGKTNIPHGAPFYGEYLDVVSYAHRGHMTWQAINASVQKIKQDVDGLISWDDIYNNYRILQSSTPWNSEAWIDWGRYLGNPAPVDENPVLGDSVARHTYFDDGTTVYNQMVMEKVTPDWAGGINFALFNKGATSPSVIKMGGTVYETFQVDWQFVRDQSWTSNSKIGNRLDLMGFVNNYQRGIYRNMDTNAVYYSIVMDPDGSDSYTGMLSPYGYNTPDWAVNVGRMRIAKSFPNRYLGKNNLNIAIGTDKVWNDGMVKIQLFQIDVQDGIDGDQIISTYDMIVYGGEQGYELSMDSNRNVAYVSGTGVVGLQLGLDMGYDVVIRTGPGTVPFANLKAISTDYNTVMACLYHDGSQSYVDFYRLNVPKKTVTLLKRVIMSGAPIPPAGSSFSVEFGKAEVFVQIGAWVGTVTYTPLDQESTPTPEPKKQGAIYALRGGLFGPVYDVIKFDLEPSTTTNQWERVIGTGESGQGTNQLYRPTEMYATLDTALNKNVFWIGEYNRMSKWIEGESNSSQTFNLNAGFRHSAITVDSSGNMFVGCSDYRENPPSTVPVLTNAVFNMGGTRVYGDGNYAAGPYALSSFNGISSMVFDKNGNLVVHDNTYNGRYYGRMTRWAPGATSGVDFHKQVASAGEARQLGNKLFVHDGSVGFYCQYLDETTYVYRHDIRVQHSDDENDFTVLLALGEVDTNTLNIRNVTGIDMIYLPEDQGGTMVIFNGILADGTHQMFAAQVGGPISPLPAYPELSYVESIKYLDAPGSTPSGDGKKTVLWGTSNRATEYPVEYGIFWSGQKISGDGDVIDDGHPVSEVGTIQLADHTINGCYLLNFAVKLPVAEGGVLLDRNKPWHNRPVNTPVAQNAISNASDAEQWFAEASDILYELTGKSKYQIMCQSSLATCKLYADVDRSDKFFRVSDVATTPFTDGISYGYTYPSNVNVVYDRTESGLIHGVSDAAVRVTLEQQSIWYKVNELSALRLTIGGTGGEGPLAWSAKVGISPEKKEDSPLMRYYVASLPSTNSVQTPVDVSVPIGSLVRESDDNGKPYLVFDSRMVDPYGGAITTPVNEVIRIAGDSYDRQVTYDRLTMTADNGVVIGFSFMENPRVKVQKFTYRSLLDEYNLRIEDADGWRWYWLLPVSTQFTTFELDPSKLVLSGYQPNHPDTDPRPSAPNYVDSADFTLLMDTNPKEGDTSIIDWYCINDIPAQLGEQVGYTMMFRLECSSDGPCELIVGDCYVSEYLDNNLAYTPGVIPFSNNYDPFSKLFDSWHGMPYPGYQYPWIWIMTGQNVHLNNMIRFLCDSQTAYTDKFGVKGPVAAAYYWNRWDSLSYGPPDTFTFNHWGDGEPWSGYQPRAFLGGCLAVYTLKKMGREVPQDLLTFCLNWTNWLAKFEKDNNGMNPTVFPSNALPSRPADDFTGHMTALWLAGACYLAMAGYRDANVDLVVKNSIQELKDNVVNIPGNIMDGSWSPGVRLGTDNGMFFGFWAGEILRGIGLYQQYLQYRADNAPPEEEVIPTYVPTEWLGLVKLFRTKPQGAITGVISAAALKPTLVVTVDEVNYGNAVGDITEVHGALDYEIQISRDGNQWTSAYVGKYARHSFSGLYEGHWYARARGRTALNYTDWSKSVEFNVGSKNVGPQPEWKRLNATNWMQYLLEAQKVDPSLSLNTNRGSWDGEIVSGVSMPSSGGNAILNYYAFNAASNPVLSQVPNHGITRFPLAVRLTCVQIQQENTPSGYEPIVLYVGNSNTLVTTIDGLTVNTPGADYRNTGGLELNSIDMYDESTRRLRSNYRRATPASAEIYMPSAQSSAGVINLSAGTQISRNDQSVKIHSGSGKYVIDVLVYPDQ